jgi:hypothetical protein
MHRHVLCILLLTTAACSRAPEGDPVKSPRYTFDVQMADRYPQQLPIQLTLVVTNHDSSPMIYSRTNGIVDQTFPTVVQIDGAVGFTRRDSPFASPNGMSEARELAPGASLHISGVLRPLPAGSYTIIFCPEVRGFKGWPRQLAGTRKSITVVDDPKLRADTLNQWRDDMLAGDPLVERLTRQSRHPELDQILCDNLSSDDDRVVSSSAYTLNCISGDPPANLVPALAAALNHRVLTPPTTARSDFTRCSATIALLRLARLRPDARYLPAITKLLDTKYTYVRPFAIKALASQRSDEAINAIAPYLRDSDIEVRETAACALAIQHDPIAIEALLALAQNPLQNARPWIYGALSKFPEDPRTTAAIQTARSTTAPRVREAAMNPTLQIPP